MYVISRLSQSCIQYGIDIIILLDMVNRLTIRYGYKYHSLVLSMVGYLEMYLGVHLDALLYTYSYLGYLLDPSKER